MFYKNFRKLFNSSNFTNNAAKKKEFIENYSSSITKLYEFKVVINKLIEEKKFHYSVINQSVSELVDLSQLTNNHTKILLEMIKLFDLKYSAYRSLFLDEKICYLNLSSVAMSYTAFLELLKYIHESKEEDINNIIRDIIENDYQDEILNTNLLLLRDEWRDSFSPEVLDENSKPVYNLNIVDKINLEVNKKTLDFIL